MWICEERSNWSVPLPANRNAVSLGMSLKVDHRNCAGQALVSAELCEPFRLVGQINLDSLERDTLQRHQSMHQRGGLTVRDTKRERERDYNALASQQV